MADSLAYIGVDHKTKNVVAAFRGTQSVTNWIQNLNGVSFKYNKECVLTSPRSADASRAASLGNCNKGFCAYYQSLDPFALNDQLYALHKKYPRYEMLFTGHSMGGAVASMAATHFGLLYPKINPLVYTLGEPRAGDISFARKFEKSGAHGYRVVHDNDMVPHVSPECTNYNKRTANAPGCPVHVSTQVQYKAAMKEKSKYTICDGSPDEDHRCSGPGGLWMLGVGDHLYYFDINVSNAADQVCSLPDREGAEKSPGKGGGRGRRRGGRLATT